MEEVAAEALKKLEEEKASGKQDKRSRSVHEKDGVPIIQECDVFVIR